jgi:hypothetical protein
MREAYNCLGFHSRRPNDVEEEILFSKHDIFNVIEGHNQLKQHTPGFTYSAFVMEGRP